GGRKAVRNRRAPVRCLPPDLRMARVGQKMDRSRNYLARFAAAHDGRRRSRTGLALAPAGRARSLPAGGTRTATDCALYGSDYGSTRPAPCPRHCWMSVSRILNALAVKKLR